MGGRWGWSLHTIPADTVLTTTYGPSTVGSVSNPAKTLEGRQEEETVQA